MSAIFGETLTFGQAKGPDIKLQVVGDEFYSRYETLDGFTVVNDGDRGLFCYADLIQGHFVSTGVPVTAPPPRHLVRHLMEAPAVRKEKFWSGRSPASRGRKSYPAADTMRTFGPNNGLLSGRRLSSGKIRGLVILVEFQDIRTTVTKEEVSELLNGTGYKKYGNYCSVQEYFLTMSSGKLEYTSVVVGPLRLSRTRDYYADHLLVEEALKLAVAAGVDLKQFDSRNEGILDALSVMYAGQTQYVGELWPHNYNISLTFGTIRTNLYTITSMGRTAADLSIGTFCHEMGHLLCRFPDLYDYGERDGDLQQSAGIGYYCLMGSGNHLNSGRTPSPVCAFLRDLTGWCDEEVMVEESGDYSAEHGAYGQVIKFRTAKLNEYFLLENRSRLGLDDDLPASGLAVYHCDILGSNELQEGGAGKHYQCALLQADGNLHLERNLNSGDGGDLYNSAQGIVLSSTTNPSSRTWAGSDSKLILSNVSLPGPKMTFSVGPGAAGNTAAGEVVAAMPIPDNNPSGVSSAITLSTSGTVADVSVNLDITHTYISDLVVELESPDGRKAILHNLQGGAADNIVAFLDSKNVPALASFAGCTASGVWTLRVRDLAGQDVGTLNRWSLKVSLANFSAAIRGEASPKVRIPDNEPAGIGSAISFTQGGNVRQIKLCLDIKHTNIGDLRVELLAPTGKRAILQNRAGGSSNDIKVTYDSAIPGSPLAPLVGQPVTGDWILRITDLSRRYVGKLNKWSLDFVAQ